MKINGQAYFLPKQLKLYDYKCFYLLNDDFGGKFQNPFSPKLFTEFFGDLIKNPPNICSPKIFAPIIFVINVCSSAGFNIEMIERIQKLQTFFNDDEKKSTKKFVKNKMEVGSSIKLPRLVIKHFDGNVLE